MTGSRFGLGALSGLLVGLLVVASSGLANAGLYGSFTSSAAYVTNQPPRGTTNATLHKSYPYDVAFGPNSGVASPSLIGNVAAQPPQTNLVVLLPLLVAIALGGAVYRVSLRRTSPAGE